jgi:hypothetical protein
MGHLATGFEGQVLATLIRGAASYYPELQRPIVHAGMLS